MAWLSYLLLTAALLRLFLVGRLLLLLPRGLFDFSCGEIVVLLGDNISRPTPPPTPPAAPRREAAAAARGNVIVLPGHRLLDPMLDGDVPPQVAEEDTPEAAAPARVPGAPVHVPPVPGQRPPAVGLEPAPPAGKLGLGPLGRAGGAVLFPRVPPEDVLVAGEKLADPAPVQRAAVLALEVHPQASSRGGFKVAAVTAVEEAPVHRPDVLGEAGATEGYMVALVAAVLLLFGVHPSLVPSVGKIDFES